MRAVNIEVQIVGVSRRTNWINVMVTDEHGNVGVGEGSLDGYESMVRSRVMQLHRKLAEQRISSIQDFVAEIGMENTPANLVDAAALSAIEQALWDLIGQRNNLPVYALLGSVDPAPVPVYANVNRSLSGDRSADAFGVAALRAKEAGFLAIKCAPFDGLRRANVEDRVDRALFAAGIDRLRAVRKSIGTDIDLMIDCSYSFTARSFIQSCDQLAELNPYWIEAPVGESRLDEWARIRAGTDLRLAGGELISGLSRFAKFIQSSGVDVVMPDIKYAGGISGLRSVATIAQVFGAAVSPHNPSGPVGTRASLHAVAGLSNFLTLELAHGECDWRGDLINGGEPIERGRMSAPDAPGLGITISKELADLHPELTAVGMDLRANG